MVQRIEVVVKENDVVVEVITEKINKSYGELLSAIQVVGQATNELLTKMIEIHGIDSKMESDEDDEEDDSEAEKLKNSPKKRKT